MRRRVEARLAELGVELPEPSAPGANYVPFVRTGDLLFVTGQLSQWNGERRFIGKLGREFGVDEGQRAARLCANPRAALSSRVLPIPAVPSMTARRPSPPRAAASSVLSAATS